MAKQSLGTKIELYRSGNEFVVPGTLTIGDKKTAWLLVPFAVTCTGALAVVETAPTGQALTMQLEKSSDQGGSWSEVVAPADFQIADGAKSGSKTGLAVSLAAGDVLRLNIDQVGSGVAGADLTVTMQLKVIS